MLSRRDFLTTSGLILIGSAPIGKLLAQTISTGDMLYSGWVPSRRETLAFKSKGLMFSKVARQLSGTGAGKRALLWKFFEGVTGRKLTPYEQTIGDCVAQAYAMGVNILDSVQIAHGKGSWVNEAATCPIYAGGRIEIGKGVLVGDGMAGSWGAQWCQDYGILLQQPYLDGKYDFTEYSGSESRKWAHLCKRCTPWGGGVPDELEPLARKHPVKTVTLITSWEQARDAIYNGYPVIVCSQKGFQKTRDSEGFAKASGTWFHSMLLAGMDDTARPGGLFINSWGSDWIEGPERFDQPLGSFWADAKDIDEMLSVEDSFAISNYVGYPRQNLDYKLY